MLKKIKCFVIIAAFILSAVMSACGNKADMELSLTDSSQGELTAGPESQQDAAPDTGGNGETSGADPQSISNDETETQQPDGPIFVHICGAVRNPDVYEMDPDDRIIDAVKLAGGFTDEADSDYHNLSAGLTDGQKIYVPTEQEVADGVVPAPELNSVYEPQDSGVPVPGSESADGKEDGDKVNINTATLEEFKTLNGIGEKRAQDIIDYRTKNGSFKTIDDIKKVNGIKDGIFSKICDDITV